MQYNMVNKGPKDLIYRELKYVLTKPGDFQDIYWRFDDIFLATPKGYNPFVFMGKYSIKTIFMNIPEYMFLSIKEFPNVLFPLYEDDIYHLSLPGLENIHSSKSFKILYKLYVFLWIKYKYLYLILIFISIPFLFKDRKIKIYFLLFLLFYYFMIISFTAYDSYSRLKMIVSNIVIIISFYSIKKIIDTIAYFYKKIKK